MTTDRIRRVESFSIRLPRDAKAVRGTAGSPTRLASSGFDYRWSERSAIFYSVNFEAALVKVTLASGRVGWGEAQAPLAPDVACLIVEQLLRPAIEGLGFDGSPARVAELRHRMYSTMRVRGQSGGFMLDAMAGVDLALWDLAGKISAKPVADLVAREPPRRRIPSYLSGLPGRTNEERVEHAREAWSRGFRVFKLFHDRGEEELFDLIDRMRVALGSEASIAVDALWRLDSRSATAFGSRLDARGALWLECPLAPESASAHAELAAQIDTPIALGESYRSRREMARFLEAGCVGWLQPDLGRWGLSEAVALARERGDASRIAPHVSIAMGPQIAAALHFAAACDNVLLAEYNPAVFSVANRFMTAPLATDGAHYLLPSAPGLGVTMDEAAVRSLALRPVPEPVSIRPET